MKAAILLLALALPTALPAQGPVRYEVSFPNARHHEAEVSVTFPDVPRRPLEVRMSRSSPGRYSVHEFAKNVYNLRAFDGRGRPLAVTRAAPQRWEVAGHDGTVRVTYTLFGNLMDGTYTHVDASHAHLNAPATFLWSRETERRPVRITFQRPDTAWRIATQLVPVDGEPDTYTAPDFRYLMDSPVEIAPLETRSWQVTSGGKTQTFRLAVHHRGTPAEVDRFAAMLRALVEEEIGVYGELPAFDFGTYTFIADYFPWIGEDAMEHRNSSYLMGPLGLDNGAVPNAALASHELFHAWNAERLRPRSLEPFDFTDANLSGELWFVEGFTSYYDDLFPARAGLTGLDQFVASMSDALNTVLSSPALRVHSPVEMSQLAPYADAAVFADPTNQTNTYVSHYEMGTVLGLGLDMMLRARSPEVTLDDYMRALWQDFGRFQNPRTYSPERPYTLADLRTTLAKVTGDQAFADDFFRRHIEGREPIDFEKVLAPAGLLLRKAAPGRAAIGAGLSYEGGQAVILTPTVAGRAAYEAGLEQGDRIVTLNGRELTSAADAAAAMQGRQVGDTVVAEVERNGTRWRASLVLRENPRMELVTYETARMPVTDEIRAFRERLLASRARRP